MFVFKFGGASIRSAKEVVNAAEIIRDYNNVSLVVVVSAMGKTTNALEKLTGYYLDRNHNKQNDMLSKIKNYHFEIAENLFNKNNKRLFDDLNGLFDSIENILNDEPGINYNFEYDRIVSFGEDLSALIISNYLNEVGVFNQWFNAKDIIKTDAKYRDANIDWDITNAKVKENILPFFKKCNCSKEHSVAIIQGFVGGTQAGYPTTLGREGSDYSAAILAYVLNAEKVVVWKDVPGLLNADPEKVQKIKLLDNISYREAVELAYYGAKVIHPKTLKPLRKKNIPLIVKPFFNPKEKGTIINDNNQNDQKIPSFIIKQDQVLLSISAKDFSFIAENNLSYIFSEFAKHNVKINMMQNSAISFLVCFDFDRVKTPALINGLEKKFNIKCIYDKVLLTIRHYKKIDIAPFINSREVILEQKTKDTIQILVKDLSDLSYLTE